MSILNVKVKLEQSRFKDDPHVLESIEQIQASIFKVAEIANTANESEKNELNARLIKTMALINALLNNDNNPSNDIKELNKAVTSLID